MNTKKRLAMTLVGFASLAGTVSGAVLNVPGNYPNIQLAINAASLGDTVLVANGSYSGAGNYNIDTLGKAITVQSAGGPGNCVIDVNFLGDGFVIQSGESAATVIDGFGVINVAGTMFKIDTSDPTISNCTGEGAVLKNSASVFTNVDCQWNGIWITGGAPMFTGCGTSYGVGLHSVLASVALVNCSFIYEEDCGVTVENGVLNATGCQIYGNVGGVRLTNASATLGYCNISANEKWQDNSKGGGIYLVGSNALAIGCTINGNKVGYDYQGRGGGVYIDGGSSATFSGCQINSNIAYGHIDTGGWGGGVAAYGPAAYYNCTIKGNNATEIGGGIYSQAAQKLSGCLVAQNTLDSSGGGMVLASGSSVIGCTIAGNAAGYEDGTSGGGALATSTWFERCLFKGNTLGGDNCAGAGAYSIGGSTFVNCVFVGNQAAGVGGIGGGVNVTNTDKVVDCTFYGNTAPTAPGLNARITGGYIGSDIFWGNGPNPVVGASILSFCDVEGGYNGPGNINADPKFVNAAINDFRLKSISPCIDAGNNSLIPGGVNTDYKNDPRRTNDPNTVDTGGGAAPIVDIGAYEFIGGGYQCPKPPILGNDPTARLGPCAISGDVMVVGAPGADLNGQDSGAAYLYTRDEHGEWVLAATLGADTAKPGDFFGDAVAIDGDTVIVGAPRNDDLGNNAGACYYFKPSEGVLRVATLYSPDAAPGDQFGFAVAVSGDRVLAGSRRADPDGISNAGAAYIFRRMDPSWAPEAKLIASDAAPSSSFGWSVALSGMTAVIGAPDAYGSAGQAYIFQGTDSGWFQEAALLTPDAAPGDQFGYAVGVSGERALVGAPGHDGPGAVDSGAAYLFRGEFGVWSFEASLANSPAEGALAGESVALQGERAAIGAPGPAESSGSAAMYALGVDVWEHAFTTVPDGGTAGDEFGRHIALEGDTLAVGAPLADSGPIVDAGSLYPVSLSGCNPPVCYADFNQDDALDLFDFLGYVNSFNAGEDQSDCTHDGSRDLFDFLCYVNAFNTGC